MDMQTYTAIGETLKGDPLFVHGIARSPHHLLGFLTQRLGPLRVSITPGYAEVGVAGVADYADAFHRDLVRYSQFALLAVPVSE